MGETAQRMNGGCAVGMAVEAVAAVAVCTLTSRPNVRLEEFMISHGVAINSAPVGFGVCVCV